MNTKIMKVIISAIIFLCAVLMNLQIAFAEPHIQINSHAKYADGGFISEEVVYYIITNSKGQRLGYDPRTNQRYNEFGGGSGAEGIDEFYTVEAGFIPIEGTYTIEVIGTGLMVFSLDISPYREIRAEGLSSTLVHGITDKGLSSIFKLTYTSDPTKPATDVVRVATPSSLKQDITLSQKIGWISEHVMKKLLEKVDDIEEAIKENNPSEAKEEVNDFMKEVKELEAEYKEVKEEETKEIIKKKIAPEAVKMFLEDAQYIMEHL